MPQTVVDVAIIGAGTAGMAAYREALQHTDRVVLIEGGDYGTTCARVGCMPSKLLIAAADAADAVRGAAAFGVAAGPPRISGRRVMARVRDERDRFVRSVLEAVDAFPVRHRLRGRARFLDRHRLQVGEDVVTADRVVIATGSRAAVPEDWARTLGDRLVVNDDVFYWDDLPGSVAVFGAGPIGLELGQALHRLGVRVRLFGKGGAVGALTDPAVIKAATAAFTAELQFLPDAETRAVRRDGDAVEVVFVDGDGAETRERFDFLLAATGRRPNVDGLDLGAAGLPLDESGVPVFDRFTGQVGDTPVFIAGDADAAQPLLHEAADDGRIAGGNAGAFPDVRERPRRTPLAIVFTDPQLAVAGRSGRELQDAGTAHAAGEVSFDDQGRSRVITKNRGLLRIYGEAHSGVVLGAEMAGPAAEHIGHLLAWSIQQGLTVEQMLACPFYHPVVEEGVRTALRDLRCNLRMGPPPVAHSLDCGPGG